MLLGMPPKIIRRLKDNLITEVNDSVVIRTEIDCGRKDTLSNENELMIDYLRGLHIHNLLTSFQIQTFK